MRYQLRQLLESIKPEPKQNKNHLQEQPYGNFSDFGQYKKCMHHKSIWKANGEFYYQTFMKKPK